MIRRSQLHGRWIVDYEERVKPDRLRKERLERLQDEIRSHGLGALLLYDPSYIQYATGTRHQRLFTTQRFLRYALVFPHTDPLVYELVGPEHEHRRMFAPWLANRVKPAIVWQYAGPAAEEMATKWAIEIKNALRQEGVADVPLGVDKVHLRMLRALSGVNIDVIDGMDPIWDATGVKTRDELELMRLAAAINDAAFEGTKEAIKTGMTGYNLAGIAAETLYSFGCECIEDIIIATGWQTNPYLREITDKMVGPGDLVIMDLDPTGPSGYCSDFARTYVNSKKATEEQKEVYKECYDILQRVLVAIRAGASTREVAEKMPADELEQAEKHETTGLLHYAHGIGINLYEPPFISRAYSLKHSSKLKENMVLAVETYAGRKGGRDGVRLEENIIVTGNGCELISLCPHDERLIDL
jgi:Xaa-Pro dipeptidase